MYIDLDMFPFLGNMLQNNLLSNEFRVVRRHLPLNLAQGNTCTLTFVESFEFVYAQCSLISLILSSMDLNPHRIMNSDMKQSYPKIIIIQ